MAFQRQLLKETTIHIGMKGGIVLDKILALDGHGGGGAAHFEGNIQADGHDGSYVDVLNEGAKATHDDREVVRVEGQIGELEVS